jgi:hypothetical protein
MKAATIVILILFPLIALAETVRETKDLALSAGEINLRRRIVSSARCRRSHEHQSRCPD